MNHYKKILTIILIIMIFMNSFVYVRANAACGNKIIEADKGERCEPPNVGACNAMCVIEPFVCLKPDDVPKNICGNLIVEPANGNEQCDDGNDIPDDRCDNNCMLATCDAPGCQGGQCPLNPNLRHQEKPEEQPAKGICGDNQEGKPINCNQNCMKDGQVDRDKVCVLDTDVLKCKCVDRTNDCMTARPWFDCKDGENTCLPVLGRQQRCERILVLGQPGKCDCKNCELSPCEKIQRDKKPIEIEIIGTDSNAKSFNLRNLNVNSPIDMAYKTSILNAIGDPRTFVGNLNNALRLGMINCNTGFCFNELFDKFRKVAFTGPPLRTFHNISFLNLPGQNLKEINLSGTPPINNRYDTSKQFAIYSHNMSAANGSNLTFRTGPNIFRPADFTCTNLSNGHFENTFIRDPSILGSTEFSGANLTNANFTAALLRRANFSSFNQIPGATVTSTIFDKSLLNNSNFQKVVFEEDKPPSYQNTQVNELTIDVTNFNNGFDVELSKGLWKTTDRPTKPEDKVCMLEMIQISDYDYCTNSDFCKDSVVNITGVMGGDVNYPACELIKDPKLVPQ